MQSASSFVSFRESESVFIDGRRRCEVWLNQFMIRSFRNNTLDAACYHDSARHGKIVTLDLRGLSAAYNHGQCGYCKEGRPDRKW